MARPLRPAPMPPAATASSSSSAHPTKASSSTSTPRTSSRPRRSSPYLSTAPSTPYTPGPQTPSDAAHRLGRPSTVVEAKAHGLRSVGGASEKTPCPFPGSYGGRDKCGLLEEDEADEALMSILSAIASLDNRALSAEEIASTCFQQGWLRPPSAAIEPTTLINNTIRAYLKRCEKTNRHCLLAKQQLAGSVVESVLEPALHPDAFSSPIRPKGTVWFLAGGVGKTKWKNPFDGLEVPKLPPRKPAAPGTAPRKQPKDKESKTKTDEKKPGSGTSKGKGKPAPPVKIRLVLNGVGGGPGGSGDGEDESVSDVGSSTRSRSMSVGREAVPPVVQSIPLPLKRTKIRRVRDILDSSSDSDTSDSDMDFDGPIQPRLVKQSRPLRKNPPTPLSLGGSPRISSFSRIPQHSPFMELFMSPVIPSIPPFAPPHSSPFPSHSLDNTTWTARHDRVNHFETSSSSSDDDIRDLEWGISSDIMMKSPEGDDERPPWSIDGDEAKVKEATDALRVLFPMSSVGEEAEMETKIELNRLDNRVPSSSELSSLVETSSVTTAHATFGQLRAEGAGGIPLNSWWAHSSPVASPNLIHKNLLPAPDISPTQHISKLAGSFETADMDVDDETPWLDESGELPVKAEDTLSDVDIGSTIGDAATPEHDRQLHTALWAREAAAIVKREPEDYPSPVTTDADDQSATGYLASRASSTPSSGSSELPPFEIDADNGRMGLDEVILGPESVTVEELDGWLPSQGKAERTPHRGRSAKTRHHPSRLSGNWGGIGVCNSLTHCAKAPIVRTRSTRSTATARRRRSSPRTPHVSVPERLCTPETDADVKEEETDDAIGTADLEKARAEAEAREEQHRKACKDKAEQQRALLEAYRQTVRGDRIDSDSAVTPASWTCDIPAPWGSGSTDSLNLLSPTVLSPMSLHNDVAMQMQMLAVDPKALVSPPLQRGFNTAGSPIPSTNIAMGFAPGHPVPEMGLGSGMLEAACMDHHQHHLHHHQRQQQQDGDIIMTSGAGAISPAVPPSALTPTPAPATVPASSSMQLSSTAATTNSISISPKGKSKLKPISPAVATATTKAPMPLPPAITVNHAPASISPSAVSSLGPSEKPTASGGHTVALPVASKPTSPVPIPNVATANLSVTARSTPSPSQQLAPSSSSTVTTASAPVPVPLVSPATAAPAATLTSAVSTPSSTVSGSVGASSTPSAASTNGVSNASSSANGNAIGNGNGTRSGGKVSTITKPLCPGVDACVVDNIPVYAHVFDGKAGLGRQVLLRRLDTDFVNANALLYALGVPEAKHFEYFDKPISPIRLAARYAIQASAGAEYSPGVSGVWVHLSEAREFAKRAKLVESSLLSSVLREDLFQLFASLAGIKPDHPPSETFGLPFVPRQSIASAPGPAPGSNSTLSTNSKSTPNLPALSSSAPAPPSSHLRASTLTAPTSATSMSASAPSSNSAVAKGPLVRTAPNTPPDGCPQPKRRRNTVSVSTSPLAAMTKKPLSNPQQPSQTIQQHPQQRPLQQKTTLTPAAVAAIAAAPPPAASTRMSVAAAKRATRASIGGPATAGMRSNMAK